VPSGTTLPDAYAYEQIGQEKTQEAVTVTLL